MLLASLRPRWTTRRDIPALVAIDRLCFPENPLGKRGFLEAQQLNSSCIGRMVEDAQDRAIAFSLYRWHANHAELIRLAVRPESRRRGIALELLDDLTGKLSARRCRALADVPEWNLPAQLLFRAAGWRAISTDRRAETYRFAGYPPVALELTHPTPTNWR